MTAPARPPLRSDYGPGSCLSCGGQAGGELDERGHETVLCPQCGVVAYVVFTDDRGAPLQGFMSPTELKQLALWETDDGEDILF
jgi:hypothetical protein